MPSDGRPRRAPGAPVTLGGQMPDQKPLATEPTDEPTPPRVEEAKAAEPLPNLLVDDPWALKIDPVPDSESGWYRVYTPVEDFSGFRMGKRFDAGEAIVGGHEM